MKSFHQDPKRRSIVVPRSDQYGAFGSALVLLPDETLLLGYMFHDFTRDVCEMRTIASADRGRSWSRPRIVYESPMVNGRADSMTRLSDGRIALLRHNMIRTDSLGKTAPFGWGGKIASHGFNVCYSTDDGVTWSDPVAVAEEGTVPWCNRIVETAQGAWVITCRAPSLPESKITRPNPKFVMQCRSTDQGQTWQGPQVIAEDPVLKLTEPSTIRLRDDRLMTVIRETSYVNFPSYKIFSNDGGETWSALEELPFIGHELCLGQLLSGRVLIGFRNMGSHNGSFAWVGDADEDCGYQVCGTLRCKTPPRIEDGTLKIRTTGHGETALYHLQSPESADSTVQIDAELRCVANLGNACAIHVARCGWVAFYPDRIEWSRGDHVSAPVDGTQFHHYTIVRRAGRLVVSVDGQELLAHDLIVDPEKVQSTHYGSIHYDDFNAFGTQSPFRGELDAEAQGEAQWRSVKMVIDNPHHPRREYQWEAKSGQLPNQYEHDRIIEIDNNYGGNSYHAGQAHWTQFADGEIFMVTGRQFQTDDGKRGGWLLGCRLDEDDFPA
jgi:hypothetical protein